MIAQVANAKALLQTCASKGTWGEAVKARTSTQATYLKRDNPNGSFIQPKVTGQKN